MGYMDIKRPVDKEFRIKPGEACKCCAYKKEHGGCPEKESTKKAYCDVSEQIYRTTIADTRLGRRNPNILNP